MVKTKFFTLLFLTMTMFSFSQSSDLRPKFRIGFDAPKIDHRQILLTIDKRASIGIDWGFDALMYQVFSDDMYWVIENKKYIIQAIDTLLFEQEIPLGIQTLTGGEITIKIDQLENVAEEMVVFLKDKENNALYDLRKESYTTTLPAGNYHNTYSLVFKMKKHTHIPDENAMLVNEDINPVFNYANGALVAKESETLSPNITLYLNNMNSSIAIKNPKSITINTVILYNMLGQKVQSWETNRNTQHLNMQNRPKSGIYVLHAFTENGLFVKKVMVQ